MLKKKSIITWIGCSLLMFALSFAWHGVVLNDFKKISYQKELFLGFLALLYLFLGFLMAFVTSNFPHKKSPIVTGSAVGIMSGLLVFLTVFVLGNSLTGHSIQATHATVDFLWQMIEQGLGGITAALLYYHFEKREMFARG